MQMPMLTKSADCLQLKLKDNKMNETLKISEEKKKLIIYDCDINQ